MSTLDELARQFAASAQAPMAGDPPAPSDLQRPYLRAGHATQSAAPGQRPNLGPAGAVHSDEPIRVRPGADIATTHVNQQPDPTPTRVDVPTRPAGSVGSNPLSALDSTPPGGVTVHKLDLAASCGIGIAHVNARPSGVPVRPGDSFTAPSGIQDRGAA